MPDSTKHLKPPVSDSSDNALGPFSRRDFLQLNLALVTLASVGACTKPDIPPDGRTEFRLLRDDDLLALTFKLRNLQIVHSGIGPGRLLRIDANAEAELIVEFPGQHVAEEVIDEAGDAEIGLPVGGQIARTSRLVFGVPAHVEGINLTVDALLNWQALEFRAPDLSPAARDGQVVSQRTLIELPTGLGIAPESQARWSHACHPVNVAGRVELWHTELTAGSRAGSTAIAIHSPGYLPSDNPVTSLNAADRSALMGKTAEARTLLLSAMGGWLDVRGRWEPESPDDIARWEHLVGAGQDQRVVVERDQGFLYPFGHRATLVKVTERKRVSQSDDVASRDVAVLRQRNFLVIKQASKDYLHGEMALQTLTATTLVSPALHLDEETKNKPAFWIETARLQPYLFPFDAADWDSALVTLQAPALFVRASIDKDSLDDAWQLYQNDAYLNWRSSPLRAQAAVVARYQPAEDSKQNRAAEPDRNVGDTTLTLLQLEFVASSAQAIEGSAPFDCQTAAMEVRLPALEPHLADTKNRGWFSLRDPDANQGEVFAEALSDRGELIPMYFDQQADLSGGVAAPSFDVGGISRVFGAVGDAEIVASGAPITNSNYFDQAKAQLLGGFSLTQFLPSNEVEDDTPSSPAIPRFKPVFRKLKSAEDKEPDEPSAEDDPEVPDEKPEKPEKPAGYELGLELAWTVPLSSSGSDKSLVAFETRRDTKGESLAKLDIKVEATRVFGKKGDEPATDESSDSAESTEKAPAVTLKAEGKLSEFNIVLNLSDSDRFSIGFHHIHVKLGPPKADKPQADDDQDPVDAPTEQKPKRKIEPEVDIELADIDASGALNILKIVIEAATNLPPLPDLSNGDLASAAYPARLPGVGSADLNKEFGPFSAPDFKLLQFDVSNVAAAFGIGLNFLPRVEKEGEPERVPDHVFSIAVASADKPLTLLAKPWGGIAHLGLNFSIQEITGLQFSVGVVYVTELDLVVTRAKCDGSLAISFTYWLEEGEGKQQFDLILKLNGQAKLWYMDVHLGIVAVATCKGEVWSFYAELMVNVQISFFTVQVTFKFYYEVAGDAGQDRLRGASPKAEETLSEAEWLAYRSAFSLANVA